MQYNDALKEHLVSALGQFDVRSADTAGHRHAAVAVGVTDGGYGADLAGLPRYDDWQSHAALILTKRSSKLRNHPGQWALPGGRIDQGETPEQAALREMHEEVGLSLPPTSIIGRLDDFATRSGFVMTPIVVWIGERVDLIPNENEVDSIHRIPVMEFNRDDAPMLNEAEGDEHPVLRMPVGDTWIAAPTAAILYQFREVCIRGRATRVAHFDQPEFARR